MMEHAQLRESRLVLVQAPPAGAETRVGPVTEASVARAKRAAQIERRLAEEREPGLHILDDGTPMRTSRV